MLRQGRWRCAGPVTSALVLRLLAGGSGAGSASEHESQADPKSEVAGYETEEQAKYETARGAEAEVLGETGVEAGAGFWSMGRVVQVNLTCGAWRSAAFSTWKSSAAAKLNIPEMKLFGKVSRAVL